jgi:uncharacterized protein (DUF58 family)
MKRPGWLGYRVPDQRWLWSRLGVRFTRAGAGYLAVWLGLLATGLYQQYNLILLTAGLAAGPLAASLFMSASMLRKLTLTRRPPQQLFEGEPLVLDYTLKNTRRTTAALAVDAQEELDPQDKSIPGAQVVRPRVAFERVGPGVAQPLRWQGPPLVRGKYNFASTDLATRSPFGLLERRVVLDLRQQVLVYPKIGTLTRRWRQLQRDSKETRRGRRHDRTAQQQEYHGLRDYRSGDSRRWIHWRTTARTGELMVKEFEQENEQQIAILLDPWLPRSKVSPENREALEKAIRFTATTCVDACRQGGRALLLGWTGTSPGVLQGSATVRLLHEVLELLATMRGSPEGKLAGLFESLPPAIIREAVIVLVSTRHVELNDALRGSPLLTEASMRGLTSRLHLLDVSRGDLDPYIEFTNTTSNLATPTSAQPPPGRDPGLNLNSENPVA